MLKKEYNITMNCRIDELSPEEKVAVVRLINHMASHPLCHAYNQDVIQRLDEISLECPGPSFYKSWELDEMQMSKSEILEWSQNSRVREKPQKVQKQPIQINELPLPALVQMGRQVDAFILEKLSVKDDFFTSSVIANLNRLHQKFEDKRVFYDSLKEIKEK